MAKTNIVDWITITNFVVDAFKGYGIPEEDAKICADVLLESDKRGIESHGCNRFKPIYLDRIKAGIQNPVTNYEIVKETETTAVVDGHDGMGQVIGYKSMQLAIDKAKKYGMGMVVVRNSCHYGIAGYYTTMAAKQGCIGLTGTNARPTVAPTFGVEGMFGTNPLTLGVPTDEAFDFNFDAATSITQNGKLEYYERIGENLHAGTVVGADGKAIEGDAGAALKAIGSGNAALTTLGGIGEDLGGYKGYGFAMFVEFLSAVLQDGSYGKALIGKGENGEKRPFHLGHFFIAIDTDHFMGEDVCRKKAGDIIREVRSAKKAPGAERIYTAGEKEYEIRLARKDGVPINESVQKEFIAVRDELGLTQYKFPFED
ncbi:MULTISPECIES: Ldh family oxidoreductase [unclassified Clostridium]|uniref:Ldh family oxidoreductase n=1 Tax=unclassified Clostridium TaxID=2614128 RepID=UPI001106663D|nr:Ldh family oxidoreductase [Clostridium sp. BSD2780061688b_171218_E8]